ncbi:MAG TPA: FAD-dependent thymidylate synthase [Acidilobales archaeon]|nr:MAG: FAD-dependent thymidylate synthase [Thermoprotei archaeon]HDD26198.1 FAD-dependent thymidylate synthase [Acidilobales archaeon]
MVSVSMVNYTKDGEKLVAAAAKRTLSRKDFDIIASSMGDDEVDIWVKETFKRGHFSPWEHSVYTFEVKCSRVCSHQLVRHRIASYSQLSQRFKVVKEYKVITPPSIRKDEELLKLFNEFVNKAYELYMEFIKAGVPPEDARYILPQGVHTKILVTMNAREILHFLSLRMCSRAQWEIRRIAWSLWSELLKVHPKLFRYAGPRCILYENQVRAEPATLIEFIKGKAEFTISKCPEGVPKDKIRDCLLKTIKELGIDLRIR